MDSQIRFFTWCAGSGRPINLRLTLDEAESCSHSGACDLDVDALCEDEGVQAQIAAWDPETLQAELAEYGLTPKAAAMVADENALQTILEEC